MYRVAVCDDEREGREENCRLAAEILGGHGVEYSLERFHDAHELAAAIDAGKRYHLLLLDILFPEPEGMALARTLRERAVESSIIFISNCADYVLEGYDVHAVQYLLKPPDPKQLEKALLYACRHGCRPEERLTLQSGGETCVVDPADILYLESRLHTVLLHLADGTERKLRETLDRVEAQLPLGRFLRCHQSYCVNLGRVEGLSRYQARLTDGSCIPVSKSRYRSAGLALIHYHTETD